MTGFLDAAAVFLTLLALPGDDPGPVYSGRLPKSM